MMERVVWVVEVKDSELGWMPYEVCLNREQARGWKRRNEDGLNKFRVRRAVAKESAK